jgi:RNA polymerase sigma-70 factor (ECF subfamily)
MNRSVNGSACAKEFEQWIDEARHGSPDALGRLLEGCRAYLLLVANRSIKPELRATIGPSDVVQETFLKAHRKFHQFAGQTEAELLGWLRRILCNHLANRIRGENAAKPDGQGQVRLDDPSMGHLANSLRAAGPSPSSIAQAHEEDKALLEAMRQLPDAYRRVIQWRSFDRCPFEEIGRRLNRSAEAARKLWRRAIEHLAQILGPADESD